MKQIVYISFFLLCVISCSKRYDKVRLIAGDSYQYWFCVNSDSDVKTKFYIYFDRKGKKYTIEERYSDKKCYLYDGGDVETIPTWSLVNDSVIEMGRLNRKLTIVNDTFLIITADEFRWVDTLYKVTDPSLLKKLQEVPIPLPKDTKTRENQRDGSPKAPMVLHLSQNSTGSVLVIIFRISWGRFFALQSGRAERL